MQRKEGKEAEEVVRSRDLLLEGGCHLQLARAQY